MRTLTALVVVLTASIASAQTRSVFIEELTWPEIKEAQAAGKTSAVIVAGGIEQNGHHMALAKHNVIARYVGGQIAERLGNALVYPVVPFSMAGDPIEKTGHMRLPGTISLPSEVFLGVIRGVAVVNPVPLRLQARRGGPAGKTPDGGFRCFVFQRRREVGEPFGRNEVVREAQVQRIGAAQVCPCQGRMGAGLPRRA